ncbi:uncharacterized protein F4822DRAFT_442153 [Hypoxylon trugodes]|uniref:uncharacterized protein n=1 Tax=Hypoxylon trugodes TaxID=326681 RepID=UPI00219CB8EA|nr:uncharacterized protein F4822DRAFT_442153 [Hypoxylon trugodes]KAI1390912.1 hypothetical protein F4822DRAFT_442153 [Hypoxylon trugodes]
MATAVTISSPLSDLERGDGTPKYPRKISCVRDITFKVIPFIIMLLIALSTGAILVMTLSENKPMPHEPTIVVSILLLIFFVLFSIGMCIVYFAKRYPRLKKGFDALGRPLPKETTQKRGSNRTSQNSDCEKVEPGVEPTSRSNSPAELEPADRPNEQHPSDPRPHEHPYSVKPLKLPRNKNLEGHGPKEPGRPVKEPIRRRPVNKGRSPLHNEYILPVIEEEIMQDLRTNRHDPSYSQMSSANGHPGRQERPTRASYNNQPGTLSPMTPPNHRATRSTEMVNGNSGSSPLSTPSSLIAGYGRGQFASPRAYLVRIPDDMQQELAHMIPERLDPENCLYIYKPLPKQKTEVNGLGDEPRHHAGSFKRQTYKSTMGIDLFRADMFRNRGSRLDDSDGVLVSPSPQPRNPIKKRSGVIPSIHEGKTRSAPNEECEVEGDLSPTPHHIHPALKRNEENPKKQNPLSSKHTSQEKIPDRRGVSFQNPSTQRAAQTTSSLRNSKPPIFPSPPPTARTSYRRSHPPLENEGNPYLHYENYTAPGILERLEVIRDRMRRALVGMDRGAAEQLLRHLEEAQLNTYCGIRYPGRLSPRMPVRIPQRRSSRRLYDHSAASRRTASDSSSSIYDVW